ncbi:MAG TPA: class I SAM-dependent methyltransferase [Candidatus Desulfobacillus sp.]|nr:class I SAM-dependent methyltransferase [Candidatus Desulfobacillus sp.]
MSSESPIQLEFSNKYDQAHSEQYFHKHRGGISRRLTDWREKRLARQALAAVGHPETVLDLPCGAGRFWPMLLERPGRRLLAADNSPHMIETALRFQPPEVVARVSAFQTSAFAIDLEAEAVDCVFCMRLLHHVERPEHRLAILREFHRVSRGSAIVSLWVGGNFKAWRRRLRDVRQPAAAGAGKNRFVLPAAVVEAEFAAAGFDIVARHDLLPRYAMWRVYALRKKPSR